MIRPGGRRRPRLVGVLVMLAACGGDGSPSRAASITVDSDGVHVVRSDDLGFDREPDAVLSEPIFRVGWDESGLLFERIQGGRLRDGDLLVGDTGPARIYRLGLDGVLIDSIGREGQGPGEFGGISGIALLPADSILVEDRTNARTSVLDPEGDFVRSATVARGDASHVPAGTAEDGTVIWRVFSWSPRADPLDAWLEFPVLGSRDDHASRDTLGVVPFTESITVDGRPGYRPVPILGLVAASGRGFAYLAMDAPLVRWYDASSGDEYQRLHWNEPLEPLRDEWYDGFVEAQLAVYRERGGSPEALERNEARLAAQRHLAPEFAPMVRDMVSTSGGDLWLLGTTPDFSDPVSEFLVVSSDAGCLARVRAFNHFLVLDADDRYVLGVERDEFDVQAVALYEAPRCPE